MRSDGKEVDKLTVKQGSRVARAAGKRIFVLGSDGSLKAVHREDRGYADRLCRQP